MEMVPAYAHCNVEPCIRQGVEHTVICGATGVHVPTVTGVQGCGVSTPIAAAVADATAGLAIELHNPIGVILAPAAQSFIVAVGLPPVSTFVAEVAFKVPGDIPQVQTMVAPVTAISPINHHPFQNPVHESVENPSVQSSLRLQPRIV